MSVGQGGYFGGDQRKRSVAEARAESYAQPGLDAPAPERPAIFTCLGTQNTAVAELHKVIEALDQATQPVRYVEDRDNQTEAGVAFPTGCPIVNHINENTGAVHYATAKLLRILRQLTIA